MLDGQGLARVAKRKKTERSNFDEYERGILIIKFWKKLTLLSSRFSHRISRVFFKVGRKNKKFVVIG